MTTIKMKDVLPTLTPEAAIGHQILTLVPLRGEGRRRFQDYLLASEAINAGVLTVTEVDESGSVPELLASNEADKPVLLIDGEELQGAKQNRIMNTSVLLPGKSKTRIPVSCVEQGRWSHISRDFKSGNYASSSLRQRKSRDVRNRLRTEGRAESDQGAVWDCVENQLCRDEISSPTRAMSDSMEKLADVLENYHEALPYLAGTCGIVAAVCGSFIALDAFDSPSTLEAIWQRLVASYAIDAQAAKEKTEKTFTSKAAEVLLEHVAKQNCQSFDTVGLGHDLRFEASNIQGQALETENHLLHLSVFPSTGKDRVRETQQYSRINPPSRRRR